MTELTLLLKATALLACALLARRLASDARASVRHLLLAATFAAILVLPIGMFALPSVNVSLTLPAAPGASQSTVAAGVASARITPVATAISPSHSPRRVFPSIWTMLRGIWAIGLAVSLAEMFAAFLWLRRVGRDGLPWMDGRRLAQRLASDAGITRSVDVFLHEDVHVPMTAGWRHPAILLPMDAHEWTETERLNALVHELEHVRRGDWAVRLVGRCAYALYWFHPVVWAAWRRMTLDAERACDDAVLQRTEGASYATQLVNLAERLNSASPPAPAMASRSDLAVRVSAILNVQQARGPAGVTPAVAIAATAAVVMLLIAPVRAVIPARMPISEKLLQAPTPAVAGGSPAFDVVSVKRNPDGGNNYPLSPPVGGRLALRGQTVRGLISSSYGVQDYQIIGGAEWLRTDGYDIDAIVETTPVPPPAQFLIRIRTLLADRFKLVMHNETREFPIYRLVKARADGQLGPKIRPTTCRPPDPAVPNSGFTGGAFGVCGNRLGPVGMLVGNNTMRGLANQLGRLAVIGRPVVDATDLAERFDWDLTWTRDPSAADAEPDAVSIFTALQEQLGLRLEAARGNVAVLVIDSVDRPGDN